MEFGMIDVENHLYLAGEMVEVKSAAEIAALHEEKVV